MSADYNNKKYW